VSAELLKNVKTGWKDNFVIATEEKTEAFEQLVESLADDKLFDSYQYFKENYTAFAEFSPQSTALFLRLESADKIELFKDNPKSLQALCDTMSIQDKLHFLNVASVTGSLKTCKFLVDTYDVSPSPDSVTLAFLAPSHKVAQYYIEVLEQGPKLSEAANLTAVNLNGPLLNYLHSIYGRERLNQVDSNILATAAYHSDQGRALSFIKQALENFTPNNLSLLSAYEAKNFPAFEAMLQASPSLASTARPFFMTLGEHSEDKKSFSIVIELLNQYDELNLDLDEEKEMEENRGPAMGL
jgi:hypothetical protein